MRFIASQLLYLLWINVSTWTPGISIHLPHFNINMNDSLHSVMTRIKGEPASEREPGCGMGRRIRKRELNHVSICFTTSLPILFADHSSGAISTFVYRYDLIYSLLAITLKGC